MQPPRLADWLLRRVLPNGKRGESILGDLREEFHASPSRLWYWRQALQLTVRYYVAPDRAPQLDRSRRSPMLQDTLTDLRMAVRMFRRNPGTSLLIVATLALAIGAATIGFAFADLALFRGIPVDDPRTVVSVVFNDTRGSNTRVRVSMPDYLDIRERSRTLERVSVMRPSVAPLIKDGQSRTVTTSLQTGDTIAAMGQSAFLGRALSAGDDTPAAPKVAALSHRYWQEEYGGRPDAIGTTLQIGREIYTIVGVMSPELEFASLADIDVWLPLVAAPDAPRDARNLRIMARLKPGVTFAQAAAEIAAIGDALAAEHPDTNAGWKTELLPIRDITGGDGFWVVIALFMLSVGLLIAIATANVSNLVLVRALARQRELAVRAALGARRGRIVRQLIVEGGALSLASAALSIPLTYGGLRAIAWASPERVFQQIVIDAHELLFVASLALICPLLFSIAPARAISRTDTRQILAAGGGRGTTASLRSGWLVVAQVALAVILVMASGLAFRSISAMYGRPTGFDASEKLSLTLDFNDVQYPTDELAAAAAVATSDALQRTPGVEQVAMMSALPILGAEQLGTFTLDGKTVPAGEAVPSGILTAVSPQGASAMGLRLLAGSWWDATATNVAVVSREAAVSYFGGIEQAVGRTLAYQPRSDSTRRSVRVVGVSNDVVYTDTRPAVRIWVSMDQPPRRLTYLLRVSGDVAGLTAKVRSSIASAAPAIPIENMETLAQGLKRAKSSDYVIIGMLGGFAGVALLLAAAGLFGVVSYTASRRTAEFGTRMALGASAWDVMRLVSSHSLRLLVIGLTIGLAGGVAVGRAMGSMLNGLSPADPVTIALVSGLLAVVTLVATAIPAIRAARIDPVIALRSE